MTGQLGKGNPSVKDVENLSSYLGVHIGIARKVLEHLGVSNHTRDSRNRLTFIRRMCWDNMKSLSDLCVSFEKVWMAVNKHKDMTTISQEVLGQAYTWKVLYREDVYFKKYLSQVYIHVHQGLDGIYTFMRNRIVVIQ